MNNTQRPLRHSHKRQLVYEVVQQSTDHPIADVIYERARERDTSISKGTVYRNLNLLTELGEIRKLMMPVGPDHYDFNLERHYHFICRSCNKVVDANIPFEEKLSGAEVGLPGFKTEWHRLILVGLCADCNNES